MVERKGDYDEVDVDDNGLPLEREQRRAAVTAQFEDFQRQLADLTDPTSREDNTMDTDPRPTPHPAVTAYRRDLERVEADLLDVVRHHTRALGVQIVTVALVELLGAVCQDIVTADPSAAPGIADTLAQLQLFVATTPARPQ